MITDEDEGRGHPAGMIMDRQAEISGCGRYRYRLARIWGPAPPVTFVMLNPSTADAGSDDPTIRRCIGYARRWRCGGVVVVNLYAFRSTRPADLFRTDDPVGPDNDDHLRQAFAGAGLVVAAWGSQARGSRADEVISMAPSLTALGVTKSGQPRHPLYLSAVATPCPWPDDHPS